MEAAEEYGEPPARESKHFARIALPEILPIILQLLTKQEEDVDEDEWNVSMAAGTCLSLLARATGDMIVQPVIPFIEANIKSPDWHAREAAVMAFGAILDGPDPAALETLVQQALPILLPMMQDSNVNVKDTTAYTIGCICDLMAQSLKAEPTLGNVIGVLIAGVEDKPRISANCSWSLMNLVDQLHGFDEGTTPPTGPLSPYYQGIVTALMKVTEKSGIFCSFPITSTNAPFGLDQRTKPTIALLLTRPWDHTLLKLQWMRSSLCQRLLSPSWPGRNSCSRCRCVARRSPLIPLIVTYYGFRANYLELKIG